VKSEGNTREGGPKPDWIKNAGSVLSPEICIVVVNKSANGGGKPTPSSARKAEVRVALRVSYRDTTGVRGLGMYS